MKVVVLTTSYPSPEHPVAGNFVHASVEAARVRPLAWGMTAALAGTMAANFFYLTMQFYYFYAFAALALAVPVVFARTR